MDFPAAIGFAFGFVIGTLVKFTVSTGSDVLMIGFRAIDLSVVSTRTDSLVISLIISTFICLTLALIFGKIGRELGELL